MTTFDQNHDDAAFADRDPSCDAVLERLPLHVGGDLEAALGARMDDHLAACPSCAAAAERMRAAFGAYFASEHRAAAEELGARSLWPDLKARLHETPDAAGTERRTARPVSSARGATVLGRALDGEGDRDPNQFESSATRGAREAADEALDLALQGAGTISERGVRGRTLMLVMAPLMAAAFVIAVSVSGGSLAIDREPTRTELVDDRSVGAELDGALSGLATVNGVTGAQAPDGSSLVADEGTDAPASSGLRHLMPEDDAERLIRQPLQMNDLIQDPRATGTLAGRSTWR
ncbi:hypothetical protein Pla163_19630 [Planctomycetes bacterium Pla163]|uniref:Putative zinc-finger domain-containing protein n=1 Tax=Rohdeia mirabilis TaxID=2528008 RepID=A0A518D068_9BACT|nr:hypothetical protein Pla163_19630 [Planctomycetes bacterium Pla163]